MKEAKLIIDGKEYTVQMKDEDVKAVTRPKTGYELLSEDSIYYSIAIAGILTLRSCLDDSDDIELYNVGNYYTDEQLARDIARADKLYRKLRQWQALNDDPINWNEDIEKYRISYNYGRKEIDIYVTFCRTHGVIYFSSRKTAQEAIDKFKDELTWYFTEFKQRLDERTIK